MDRTSSSDDEEEALHWRREFPAKRFFFSFHFLLSFRFLSQILSFQTIHWISSLSSSDFFFLKREKISHFPWEMRGKVFLIHSSWPKCVSGSDKWTVSKTVLLDREGHRWSERKIVTQDFDPIHGFRMDVKRGSLDTWSTIDFPSSNPLTITILFLLTTTHWK